MFANVIVISETEDKYLKKKNKNRKTANSNKTRTKQKTMAFTVCATNMNTKFSRRKFQFIAFNEALLKMSIFSDENR